MYKRWGRWWEVWAIYLGQTCHQIIASPGLVLAIQRYTKYKDIQNTKKYKIQRNAKKCKEMKKYREIQRNEKIQRNTETTN